MPRYVTMAVLIVGLVGMPNASRASLYQPDEPRFALSATLVPGTDQRENVLGQELPFDVFKERLLSLINQLNPNLKNAQGKNPDRDPVLARIAQRQGLAERSPHETIALAADLLRVGRPDEAEALLVRNRQGYLVNITLAHIYAAKMNWENAFEYLSIANSDDPPEMLAGLSPAQRAWQVQINRGPLSRLYRSRMQESLPGRKPNPVVEDVDPIFSVRFINAAGQYEPGNLAPAERAKLPADAIAIVQQMMFWAPTDSRLYWLLAELYAANGRFVEAQRILDECVSEARQYGNRKLLRDHRSAIQPLAEEQAKKRTPEAPLIETPTTEPDAASPEPAPDEPPPPPISIGAVWLYFGVVAVIGVLAGIRLFLRKGETPLTSDPLTSRCHWLVAWT